MTKLEQDLRASLEALDTEPPPATEPAVPADPVEQAAFQTARQVIRRARFNGQVRAELRPTRDTWRGLSDYQRARVALERLDALIRANPDDPTLPHIRGYYVDGVGELVRTMLRHAGVIA